MDPHAHLGDYIPVLANVLSSLLQVSVFIIGMKGSFYPVDGSSMFSFCFPHFRDISHHLMLTCSFLPLNQSVRILVLLDPEIELPIVRETNIF